MSARMNVFAAIACASVAILFFSFPALACRGLSAETRTFLERLPEGGMEKDVVGKVEILSIDADGKTHQRVSKARAVVPMKGLKKGQEFMIVLGAATSCAHDADAKAGERYFIAGQFDDEGRFQGEWKGLVPIWLSPNP